METTSPKVNEDVGVLKSDVRRLRADVVGTVHSAKSRSRDTIMRTGNRIRGMMTDLRDRAKDQVRDKSEALNISQVAEELPISVTPANAGVQNALKRLDSGFVRK